jgi:hypothetical protein
VQRSSKETGGRTVNMRLLESNYYGVIQIELDVLALSLFAFNCKALMTISLGRLSLPTIFPRRSDSLACNASWAFLFSPFPPSVPAVNQRISCMKPRVCSRSFLSSVRLMSLFGCFSVVLAPSSPVGFVRCTWSQ